MSLLMRPEAGSSYDEPAAGPPARRQRSRLVTAAVLVLIAVTWLLLPLTVRLGQQVEPQVPVEGGLFVPQYGETGTYGLHYRHHEEITIDIPVRNGGPLPLLLDKASLGEAPLPLLTRVGDNLPIEVGPWGDATLELTFRFDNCRYYHERSVDTWDRVNVGGSVLWRRFDDVVSLAYPLALHGQVIGNCPDRTLVRGDDVRPR